MAKNRQQIHEELESLTEAGFEPAFEPAQPAIEPAQPSGPKTYRVSLAGNPVLTPEGRHQQYLDVEAESVAGALAVFAAYNGIPTKVDGLTGEVVLDSVHKPVVQEL